MANMTLAVSAELKHDMDILTGVVWSDVAREEALDKIKREETLRRLDKLLKDSKLTDEDCLKWAKEARKGRYKELKSKGLV